MASVSTSSAATTNSSEFSVYDVGRKSDVMVDLSNSEVIDVDK